MMQDLFKYKQGIHSYKNKYSTIQHVSKKLSKDILRLLCALRSNNGLFCHLVFDLKRYTRFFYEKYQEYNYVMLQNYQMVKYVTVAMATLIFSQFIVKHISTMSAVKDIAEKQYEQKW